MVVFEVFCHTHDTICFTLFWWQNVEDETPETFIIAYLVSLPWKFKRKF